MNTKDAEYFIQRVELAAKKVLNTNEHLVKNHHHSYGFMEALHVITGQYLQVIEENKELIQFISSDHRELLPSQVTDYIRRYIADLGETLESFCLKYKVNTHKLKHQLLLSTNYSNDILEVFGLKLGIYRQKLCEK